MKNQSSARLVGGILALLVLIGAVLAANYVTTDYGFIPVGFGLEATAGTIFAGFALIARDAVQDTLGRLAVVAVIVVGTVLSFAISAQAIALASAAAFAVSETLDFAVYTPIRVRAQFGRKLWAVAVGASSICGVVADTVVFLGIAFGASAIMPALGGQIVGKLYATVAYLLLGRIGMHVGRVWWNHLQACSPEAVAPVEEKLS